MKQTHLAALSLLGLTAVASAQLLSFPGAEGFGRFAVGGRGGEVYHVTTLADSGPGSLRDALSKSGRTIVFDVGGVIRIGERLIVPDHTTIAGQTAPGGGITVYGNGWAYNTNNVITRHIRIRMGKVGTSGKDAIGISSGRDMIWDHVSVSWGRDGTFDANTDGSNWIGGITIQNCIIGQGLQTHSTGGLLVVDSGASVLRSLYIDNNSRNPKARKVTQFVNNVVYNWTVSGYILGDTDGRSDGYIVGNYFIPGPNTSGGTLDSPTPAYHAYASGNYYDSDEDGTLDGRLLGQGDFGSVTWETTPSWNFPKVKEIAAKDAFDLVFKNAGANRYRDAVDSLLLAELASVGKKGKQISDEVSLGLPNVVGNIPSGTAPKDTDRDGMPDAWETAHGLNPNLASDRNLTHLSADGYTNLEMYLNELAGDPVVFKSGTVNAAPVFSSPKSVLISENTTAVVQCKAADADGDAVTYSISGGEDAAFFSIAASTGALAFKAAPDFEKPADLDADNIYKVIISASDGKTATPQSIAVLVTDVDPETVGFRLAPAGRVRAQVAWLDVHGRSVLSEEQWLDPARPQLVAPAGLRGLAVACVHLEGHEVRIVRVLGIAP